jgi:acetoin utilization protein AcuB
VEQQKLAGIVSDTDLLDLKSTDQPISKLKINMQVVCVGAKQHVFEVLKVISAQRLSVIPVLDENQDYLGVITASKILEITAEMPFVNEPGAIIMLEVPEKDYSLSQIAQIVEGNDAKILSSYITARYDRERIEVTLKINKEDLSGIIQTFNRYNYTIKASFHLGSYHDDMKRRMDEFMNYLNI